jgi:hypothetical protein
MAYMDLAARTTEMIGRSFGRWTVLERRPSPHSDKKIYWLCRCECGAEGVIAGVTLRKGDSTSCGCFQRESASARMSQSGQIHGMHKSAEYSAWRAMIGRCYCSSTAGYSNYGGRGIFVCDRWRWDFSEFYLDMGARPSAEHSIDRIDVNGHYCPMNCRWATPIQQGRNRRNNHRLEYDGEILTLQEWGLRSGLSCTAIRRRLNKGWSVQDALCVPSRKTGAALSVRKFKTSPRNAPLGSSGSLHRGPDAIR